MIGEPADSTRHRIEIASVERFVTQYDALPTSLSIDDAGVLGKVFGFGPEKMKKTSPI